MKAKTPKLTPEQKAQILEDDAAMSPTAGGDAINPLAGLREFCANSPCRLISLWDMIPFRAYKLYEALLRLERDEGYIDFCGNAREQEPQNVMFCKREIAELKAFSSQLNLIETLGRVERFEASLDLCERGHKHFTIEEFFSEIRGISEAFAKELAQRQFAFIPANKACYFELDDLFGESFHKVASSEMNMEIKAAGNCLAADLNTAAVFHLIRAAEFGLREFVIHLKADKRLAKSLEDADWHELIDAAHLAIESIAAKKSKTKKGEARRKSRLKCYRTALSEFRILKDEWRNNVMHTRGGYTEYGAMDVYCRARDFLPRLQKYLKVN
jgi:hypothetical protein